MPHLLKVELHSKGRVQPEVELHRKEDFHRRWRKCTAGGRKPMPKFRLETEEEAQDQLELMIPPGEEDLPLEPILYRTPRAHGERHHSHVDCYGLQSATRIYEMMPCPRCCTPDFRRLVTVLPILVFWRAPGYYHSRMTCAGGEPVRITRCNH